MWRSSISRVDAASRMGDARRPIGWSRTAATRVEAPGLSGYTGNPAAGNARRAAPGASYPCRTIRSTLEGHRTRRRFLSSLSLCVGDGTSRGARSGRSRRYIASHESPFEVHQRAH
jgi:hypothetical protein